MKKIIFCNIPMKNGIKPLESSVDKSKSYVYPISEIFNEIINPKDSVKVLMLGTEGIEISSINNYVILENELSNINDDINASIEFYKITCEFDEEPDIYYERLRNIIKHFEEDSICYADITFGPKSLPIILFDALAFGEKFYDIDVKKIIYRKVEFVDGEIKNTKLCDMTALYTFGSLFNSMPKTTGEKALDSLDNIFKKR